MATHNIAWNTGGGNIVLSYTGEGNETVSVSSSIVNEGIDRSQVLTVSDGNNLSVNITITQLGRRQPFSGSDGKFYLSGGGTYNVLKE